MAGAPGDDNGPKNNQGAAYVFTRSGTIWTEQAKLTASDGEANDFFGASVAIDGDTLVAGAFLDDTGAKSDQGAAYVFTRSGTIWTEQQKLAASDGEDGDRFGFSVAIDGDTVVAGAPNDDNGPNINQGAAYVFTRSGTIWTEQAKLTASDGETVDEFGFSVAIEGDTAVVGSRFARLGVNLSRGAAYVFTRDGTIWSEFQKLFASDGKVDDQFGFSVAIDGNTVVAGAILADGVKKNSGAAYVFVLCPTIAISPATLPAGTVGRAYSQTLTATGGTAPFTFSVSSGVLPPGLTLSSAGVISGTPTAAGAFSFTVEALDSNGCTGTRDYTLVIVTPTPAVVAVDDDDNNGRNCSVGWGGGGRRRPLRRTGARRRRASLCEVHGRSSRSHSAGMRNRPTLQPEVLHIGRKVSAQLHRQGRSASGFDSGPERESLRDAYRRRHIQLQRRGHRR